MRHKVFKRGGYSVGSVSSAGGETLNPVTLIQHPVVDNEAATKGYVDSKTNNLSVSSFTKGTVQPERLPAFTGDLIKAEGISETTIKGTGIVPGSYIKLTVNTKGQITAGSGLVEGDIPSLPWTKVNSNLPSSLAGYGITDALPLNGGHMSGNLKVKVIGESDISIVTKAYVDNMFAEGSDVIPTGGIIYKLTNVTPEGFLKANGGEVSKTTYADLYAVIGDTFSYGGLRTGSGKPWKQQYDINIEQNGDIAGWSTGTNLPRELIRSQAIVTKNRVYLLGGESPVTSAVGDTLPQKAKVYTAPINGDGTLGTWATSDDLPRVLSQSQAIVTKNRVYLLGGVSDLSITSLVYTAPINEDGTLGAWTTGNSLPVVLCGSQAIVTKNRVYLLGGLTLSDYTSIVYTAPINEDGTLGSWTQAVNLPEPLGYSQAIITKNRVYLLSGHNDTNLSKVYTASINVDGTLGAWSASADLPEGLARSQAIVTKNRVYLLGGIGTAIVSTVYTAPINKDGTLGAWTTGTNLPGILCESQVIITKNRVYLLGGYISSSTLSKTVYTTTIQGGLNDYSSYYIDAFSTPVTGAEKTTFTLPNIQSKLLGASTYIKY